MNGVDFAWTGGGERGTATARAEPKTMLCYRPKDFKAKLKTEATCEEGLAESLRLGSADKMGGEKGGEPVVTMQAWINKLKVILEARGMDSVFRMVNAGPEQYLLTAFGRADTAKVKAWVAWLEVNGDVYDQKNLQMSGVMLKESLEVEMLKKVEREAPGDASGPVVFAAVINLHQSLSSIAVRQLTIELSCLKLVNEPAENVDTFAEKVLQLALRIQGAGPTTCPHDLPSLVYECFKGSSTEEFASEVTDVLKKAHKDDPSVDDWESIVSDFKACYRLQLVRSSWEALKNHKEKVEAQALAATISQLVEQQVAFLTKSGTGGGGSDSRQCYHCGKSGHIKPNCPDKDKPKVAGSGAASTGTTTNERKISPKEGEPHSKTGSDGLINKWCGVCKRWNSGDKAHLTEEHVKGKVTGTAATPTTAATAVPTVPVPVATGALAIQNGGQSSSTSGGLRMISGFLGQMGIPAKKNSIEYCTVCETYVCKSHGAHEQGWTHVHSEVADGLWTIVKRGRESASKDQAGQP